MNTAVEIAITGQHGGRVEIAVNHFFLNRRIERAGHAIAGCAGEGHNAESERFKLGQKSGFLQVQLHGF